MRLTITLIILYVFPYNKSESINMEVLELLGLAERPKELLVQTPALRNSASRFLRQVYQEIQTEDRRPNLKRRHKRETNEENNFITELDRKEIETCNNLITFSSKPKPLRKKKQNNTSTSMDEYLHLYFNTRNIPQDLSLFHSTLRVFYDPAHSRNGLDIFENITISVYERISYKEKEMDNFRVLTSLNLTSTYKGWLEFNVTHMFAKWVKFRKYRPVNFLNELLLDASIQNNNSDLKFGPHDLGLVLPALKENTEYDPFIIGYFNGPQLMEKMQKLRFKRDVTNRRKYKPHSGLHALHLQYTYQMPKTCERLNFTVNFKDTHMDSWVIAPKKFEAYFCGGECNFPLGAQLNATNHAIVQTLMQLKQPHLPKPCCAPTVLESITILHFLNEDNVNLVKFPQSVAKECGCL